ncbi:Short-chain dehydrogenases/reductase [Madurella fahalii]|uniref:Short-chain dehydrogenases/reductase n=1 Tax=Madurella fahalii TaxID=1157608 RepID=A0ABQ0GL19_9PEZI
MVSLEQMRASNARIPRSLPPGLVAVFVGGTSGIGETTMKKFAKHTVQPRIYFIGRSEQSAIRILAELQTLNPAGEYQFLQADVSLLQNVDHVCREIYTKEKLVNLLFLTCGTMVTGQETVEALYYPTAVTYYARIRFIANLLPLLQKASALRRVVSVYGGTKEGLLDPSNFPGCYIPPDAHPRQARAHLSAMTTLALESLALEAPDVSFVHAFPGCVRTNLGRDVRRCRRGRGAGMRGLLAKVRVVGASVGALPVAEAGERQLFLATSARFPARDGVDVALTSGVRLRDDDGVSVARGSDGLEGSGVYSVGFDGEAGGPKVEELLRRLRGEDLVRRVWVHTVAEFIRVTGSEFV